MGGDGDKPQVKSAKENRAGKTNVKNSAASDSNEKKSTKTVKKSKPTESKAQSSNDDTQTRKGGKGKNDDEQTKAIKQTVSKKERKADNADGSEVEDHANNKKKADKAERAELRKEKQRIALAKEVLKLVTRNEEEVHRWEYNEDEERLGDKHLRTLRFHCSTQLLHYYFEGKVGVAKVKPRKLHDLEDEYDADILELAEQLMYAEDGEALSKSYSRKSQKGSHKSASMSEGMQNQLVIVGNDKSQDKSAKLASSSKEKSQGKSSKQSGEKVNASKRSSRNTELNGGDADIEEEGENLSATQIRKKKKGKKKKHAKEAAPARHGSSSDSTASGKRLDEDELLLSGHIEVEQVEEDAVEVAHASKNSENNFGEVVKITKSRGYPDRAPDRATDKVGGRKDSNPHFSEHEQKSGARKFMRSLSKLGRSATNPLTRQSSASQESSDTDVEEPVMSPSSAPRKFVRAISTKGRSKKR